MLVQIVAMGAKAQIDTYIDYVDPGIRPVRDVKVVPQVMLVADVDGHVSSLGRHKGIQFTQAAGAGTGFIAMAAQQYWLYPAKYVAKFLHRCALAQSGAAVGNPVASPKVGGRHEGGFVSAGQRGHLFPVKVASLLRDNIQGRGERLAGGFAVLLGQSLEFSQGSGADGVGLHAFSRG